MGVPNRESVAEALARSDDIVSVFLAEGDSKHIDTLVAAARAWLDQGDALVTDEEVLGLAVQLLKDNSYLVEEQATAHWSALTAEERSAMPPNLRRWVTDWEPLVPLSQMGYAAAEEIAAMDQGDALVITDDMIERATDAIYRIDRLTRAKEPLLRDYCAGLAKAGLEAALSDRSDK